MVFVRVCVFVCVFVCRHVYLCVHVYICVLVRACLRVCAKTQCIWNISLNNENISKKTIINYFKIIINTQYYMYFI